MFILIRKSEKAESYLCMGDSFDLIEREIRPDEFGRIKWEHNRDRIAAFIIYNDGNITLPIYDTDKYDVYVKDGEFLNLWEEENLD